MKYYGRVQKEFVFVPVASPGATCMPRKASETRNAPVVRQHALADMLLLPDGTQ